ncbi:MAG: 6-phosphofructokinase [Clostridia bacterium]|nr:6-phosphofructokinase [Clostridia bacterium]
MEKLYGNAVVGQSGGPTAAINATLSGVIRGALAGVEKGIIGKVYGMRNGIEGLCEERLVDLGKIFTSEQRFLDLEHTPAAALGSCRKKLPNPKDNPLAFEFIIDIFKKYDIRYFFYIGGNDSMDTVMKLSEYVESIDYDMRVIGVPKTIDNDLAGTDHTPGFGSAAKYIATSVKEIICDCAVYTTKAVTITEIMGRDAGWLTASAGLARLSGGQGPDYIYLPERDFDMDSFFSDIRTALKAHPNVVIAVSEGVKFANGQYVCENMPGKADAFGHKQLSGTGTSLAAAVRAEVGCKTRAVEFNTSQRCAAHIASKTDIKESVAIGKKAVEYAIKGVSGHVMVYIRSKTGYKITIDSVPAVDVANKVRHVPDEFITPSGNNVTEKCLEYLRPLIEGEVKYRHEAGLPVHFKI